MVPKEVSTSGSVAVESRVETETFPFTPQGRRGLVPSARQGYTWCTVLIPPLRRRTSLRTSWEWDRSVTASTTTETLGSGVVP